MKTEETVRELCELIRTPRLDLFRTYDELADRILAAHEREMAAKDADVKRMHDCCDALEDEIDVKDKEISRLKNEIDYEQNNDTIVMQCATCRHYDRKHHHCKYHDSLTNPSYVCVACWESKYSKRKGWSK